MDRADILQVWENLAIMFLRWLTLCSLCCGRLQEWLHGQPGDCNTAGPPENHSQKQGWCTASRQNISVTNMHLAPNYVHVTVSQAPNLSTSCQWLRVNCGSITCEDWVRNYHYLQVYLARLGMLSGLVSPGNIATLQNVTIGIARFLDNRIHPLLRVTIDFPLQEVKWGGWLWRVCGMLCASFVHFWSAIFYSCNCLAHPPLFILCDDFLVICSVLGAYLP